MPLDKAGSKLLFQVISECHKQRSVIITTNLEFTKWVNVFYDEQMTAAMIDRLVHHSYLLLFDGQSYRIKNSLMRDHSYNSPGVGMLQNESEIIGKSTCISKPLRTPLHAATAHSPSRVVHPCKTNYNKSRSTLC